MEEPTVCIKCNDLFDLQDGGDSGKWFKGTVICGKCWAIEQEEIEEDEEVADLKSDIVDAMATIRNAKDRLKELGVSTSRYD